MPFAHDLPAPLKTCFYFGEGSKIKPLFLLFMKHSRLLKRGLLARRAAGSKEPLKGLLITFEIGQVSLFGEHHET